MIKISKGLALACLASSLCLATPALSRSTADRPKGDHPERNCKPGKHPCPVNGFDFGKESTDTPSDLDNPWGDHPERNDCKPEREVCPAL